MNNITMVHVPDRRPAEPVIKAGLSPVEALKAVRYKHGRTEVFADGDCVGYRYPCKHQNRAHGERCPTTLRYRCRWHTWVSEKLLDILASKA